MATYRKGITDSIFDYWLSWNQDPGIKIITCGYHKISPHTVYPPSGHPKEFNLPWRQGRKIKGYYLIYIVSGSGLIQLKKNMSLVSVQPGDMIFLHANHWHRYKPTAPTGWEEYWVGFDGQYVAKQLAKEVFPLRKNYLRHIGYNQEIIFLFEQLVALSKKASPAIMKVMIGSLFQLVGHILSEEKKNTRSTHEQIVHQVVQIIKQNCTQRLNYQELARSYNLSYSRFRKVFSQQSGLPLNQFVIQERLNCAQRLLRNTGLNISEVSSQAGFESLHYFSRLYKRKFGYSPKQERQSSGVMTSEIYQATFACAISSSNNPR